MLNKLLQIFDLTFRAMIEGIEEHKTIGFLLVAIIISKEDKSITLKNLKVFEFIEEKLTSIKIRYLI